MTEVSLQSFRRWVVIAGVLNIATSLPLALPGLTGGYYDMLNALNRALGLGGSALRVSDGGENQLFVNTAGVLFCVFGLLLIYASLDLRHRMGIPLLNAIERILYVLLLVYYAVAEDLAGIVLSFALVDGVIAAVFLYYGWKHRRFAAQGAVS